jgi:hypothetical protein
MIAVLLVGGSAVAWGIVQILCADRVTRFFSRLHRRLGGGVWARLLVTDPENKGLTVRVGAITAVGGLALIMVALVRGR